MIFINLLPHRETARKRHRERFKQSLILAAVAGGLLAASLFQAQSARVEVQRARNEVLRVQIQRIDAQIREITDLQRDMASLRIRQQAVEDLQVDRNLPVHLLNELAQSLPEGVHLTGLRQDQQVVLLQGVAQSNERVSEFLRTIGHRSIWLSQPELIEIVAATTSLGPRDTRRVANFQIRVHLKRSAEGHVLPTASSRAN